MYSANSTLIEITVAKHREITRDYDGEVWFLASRERVILDTIGNVFAFVLLAGC
jgi:hypothetical protein